MNKILEFGRKALFYVRVLSGYEEKKIRAYRLQLHKEIEQAQARKAEARLISEKIVLSEVRHMVEEMQKLNRTMEETMTYWRFSMVTLSQPIHLNVKVSKFIANGKWCIRELVKHKLGVNICDRFPEISPNSCDQDIVVWTPDKNGKYTVAATVEKLRARSPVSKEAAVEQYFKPLDKEVEKIMKMQLKGEEGNMKEMIKIMDKEASIENKLAPRVHIVVGVDEDKASSTSTNNQV
ncbi:hypothetical protein GIB67_032753 [Kingdonia uniflora]|uniref:Uncharacterized protein n=1 Tax=Kingdonia uniflora TaxID=39325 RepID=A0A7J7MW86_9MAGN|nr:hypothetical protein GIB67_032753 [Kingdonia uniflora]